MFLYQIDYFLYDVLADGWIQALHVNSHQAFRCLWFPQYYSVAGVFVADLLH